MLLDRKQVTLTFDDATRDGVVVPKTLDEYCVKTTPKDNRHNTDDFYDDDDYYMEDEDDDDDVYASDDNDSGNEES